MIKEDYVSFEVAKLLKEKGFPQIEQNSGYNVTEMVYSINADKKGVHHLTHRYPAVYDINNYICAPTLQMAMKWLREVRNIFIQVDYIWSPKALYTYTFDIHNMKNSRSIFSTPYGESFDSYEEACEAAIKYCLTNLI